MTTEPREPLHLALTSSSATEFNTCLIRGASGWTDTGFNITHFSYDNDYSAMDISHMRKLWPNLQCLAVRVRGDPHAIDPQLYSKGIVSRLPDCEGMKQVVLLHSSWKRALQYAAVLVQLRRNFPFLHVAWQKANEGYTYDFWGKPPSTTWADEVLEMRESIWVQAIRQTAKWERKVTSLEM
jgi:hypothetical protein